MVPHVFPGMPLWKQNTVIHTCNNIRQHNPLSNSGSVVRDIYVLRQIFLTITCCLWLLSSRGSCGSLCKNQATFKRSIFISSQLDNFKVLLWYQLFCLQFKQITAAPVQTSKLRKTTPYLSGLLCANSKLILQHSLRFYRLCFNHWTGWLHISCQISHLCMLLKDHLGQASRCSWMPREGAY